MAKVIAIVGSYRADGLNYQVAREILAGAAEAGAETRLVFLPEYDIHFCTNCRTCTQQLGDKPGKCVHDDAMAELLEACVRADALVLASPTNMGNVTAIYKRFIERLTPLAYWPWGRPGPSARKGIAPKRAVLVCSSAAPTVLWRIGGFHTLAVLRQTAKMFNARVLRVLKYGMVSKQQAPALTAAQLAAARECGRRLVA